MSLEWWLYRGGHPNRVARVLNRGWAMVYALGVAPYYLLTLEVPALRPDHQFPARHGCSHRRALSRVHARKKANWVQNVKAAGGDVTLRHGRREKARLEEVALDLRASVLKAYLKRAPGARAHLPIDKDAPLAEFERVSSHFPVFRIMPRSMA